MALVNLINSAMKTLDVEGEEFSDTYSTGVTNAVVAAVNRGVKTRVIVANSTPLHEPDDRHQHRVHRGAPRW